MHGWQDIVLAIGTLIFSAALLPSIFSNYKPAIWTCITTGLVLAVFVVTYASLSLWYATITAVLNAILWFILAGQKLLQDQK